MQLLSKCRAWWDLFGSRRPLGLVHIWMLCLLQRLWLCLPPACTITFYYGSSQNIVNSSCISLPFCGSMSPNMTNINYQLKSISRGWEQCKLQVHCFCSNIIIQMETFISCVEIFLMLLQDFKQSAFNLSLYLLLLNAATQPAWIMLNKISLSLGIYHAKSRSDKYDSQHKQIFSNWPKSASEDDL